MYICIYVYMIVVQTYMSLATSPAWYRGTLLTRKRTFLGPYRGPVPRVLGWSYGGGAVSYGRGTPVH